MNIVLMSALSSLGCATAGVTVLAIAMWLLLRLCRVRSLAIQRFAWLLVLLPGVIVWRMSFVLPVLPAGQFVSVELRSESERGHSISDVGARSPALREPNDVTKFKPNDAKGVAGAFPQTQSVRESGVWAGKFWRGEFWAGGVLVGAWVVGMVVLAFRWVWSYLAFVRGLPAPLLPADEWIAELYDVCAELGLPPAIRLHVTERLGPALCLDSGRYRLLVPRAVWGRFSVQQRRSILRHELAHYVRGDLWKSLLVRLLAWPQWFNPLAWLAVRRFEEAAECACDDAVVAAEREDAFNYLRALLELGKADFLTPTLQAAVQGGSLQRRVRRLLSPTAKDSLMKKFVVIAAALAVAAGGFARIQLASAQAPAAENKSDKSEPANSNAASLLPNGGFEEFDEETGDPVSWYATRIPNAQGTGLAGHYLLSASPKLAHGGKRSVLVAIGENHPGLPVAYNWTTELKGWKAGETYELSGWIKVEKAKEPAFIMVQFWDKNEDPKARRMIGGATTEKAFPIKGDTEWTKVSTRFTVPEGTGGLRLRAGLSSKGNRGAKAWLDDVSLVKVAN